MEFNDPFALEIDPTQTRNASIAGTACAAFYVLLYAAHWLFATKWAVRHAKKKERTAVKLQGHFLLVYSPFSIVGFVVFAANVFLLSWYYATDVRYYVLLGSIVLAALTAYAETKYRYERALVKKLGQRAISRQIMHSAWFVFYVMDMSFFYSVGSMVLANLV